jgi:hypothetical protein
MVWYLVKHRDNFYFTLPKILIDVVLKVLRLKLNGVWNDPRSYTYENGV